MSSFGGLQGVTFYVLALGASVRLHLSTAKLRIKSSLLQSNLTPSITSHTHKVRTLLMEIDIDNSDFALVDDVPMNVHDDHLESIAAYVDNLSQELRKISLEIHDHPELAYKEVHAHRVLTTYLQVQSEWQTKTCPYKLPTAFVAVFDSGRPGATVSFNAEYDALQNVGHACGHNLIAIAFVAGALATATPHAKKQLSGRVVLFGTPAEEGGGGKIKLFKAGAYSDEHVDVCLISHPGITPDTALMRTAAYTSFGVEYFGREAHAAASPWEGINALDALIIGYNGISMLRQQTHPGDIIQGQITNGGLRPNVIHAYAAGKFVVRSITRERRDALKTKVFACFQAGAAATGAQLKITEGGSYDDHVPNRTLARSYRHYFNRLGGDISKPDIDIIRGATQASTDQGNISHAMPSISAGFWIRSEDHNGKQLGGPHTPDFEKAARTPEAHDLTLRVAECLAATAVDILTRPELLREAQQEFALRKTIMQTTACSLHN